MEKRIKVGDREVLFKATASTPRRYRERFGSDLFADLNRLLPSMQNGTLTGKELVCIENFVYIMAKQADQSIPDDPDEWLDQFEVLPFYEILPQILEIWADNEKTTEKAKKKVNRQSGN